MAFSKTSPTGMQLFQDDGTPVQWNDHHRAVWNCGYKAAQQGVGDCPYADSSVEALCWWAGHRTATRRAGQ